MLDFWMIGFIFLGLYYLYKVRDMRYASLNRTLDLYSDVDITPLVAQKIVSGLSQVDAPFLYAKALSFALFKTYAIPTISRTLHSSGDLVEKSAIRAEDTALLLSEATTWNLNSERSTLAIARINYLHAQYGDKISNADMLYTLSTFMIEPVEFMGKYGWRKMDTIEVKANFILWRAIGLRMGILGIPETYEEMYAWSTHYEEETMVFSAQSRKVADGTIAMFLQPLPHNFRGPMRSVIHSFMSERVRAAFGYTQAPVWAGRLVQVLFCLINIYLRVLALPRGKPFVRVGKEKSSEGKYHQTSFLFVPKYMKWTLGTRLWCWFLGFGPGKDTAWHPEGYVIEKVGPKKYTDKGHDEIYRSAGVMRGCPFA